MTKNSADSEVSEIDIKTLVQCIWYYKFIVGLIMVSAVCLSIIYISRAEKVYSATSSFLLEQDELSRGLSGLAGQIGGLSQLAGLSTGANSQTAELIERISAREFILQLADDLNLREDKFFNSYNPNAKQPLWKLTIKRLIGWESKPVDPARVADWNVVQSSKENILIESSLAGLILVTVNHEDPQRAAEIANHIVKKTVNLVQKEKIESANIRLTYLSELVADSLQKMEDAEKKLKDFTLSNSAQAVSSLVTGSVLLANLRTQRDQSILQLRAINALKSVYEKGEPDQSDYLRLRKSFPIFDQANFRRILGISEIVSAWTWPKQESVFQVEQSIQDRVASLESEILDSEKDASKFAESAQKYATVQRELKIAESTYKVLLTQVKSQAVIANFTPNGSKIAALAVPPIGATKPKKLLIVASAAVLGFLLGTAVALLMNVRKGVFSSIQSLSSILNPDSLHKLSSLRWINRKSLSEIKTSTQKHLLKWPEQVLLEGINPSKTSVMFVIDTTIPNRAPSIARIIGTSASEIESKTAVLQLSDTAPRLTTVSPKIDHPNLVITDKIEGCTEYSYNFGSGDNKLIHPKYLHDILIYLINNYNIIVVSTDITTMRSINFLNFNEEVNIIACIAKRKTKISTINQIKKHFKVKVLLHD